MPALVRCHGADPRALNCRVHAGNRALQRRCRHLTAAVLLSHRPHPSTVRGLDVPPSIQHEEPVRRIRLAAGWRDVDTAVQELEVPDAATAAYALYRLGCLHTFMSAQRRADLEASGLVARLLSAVEAHVGTLTAWDVTFALDGLARLGRHTSTVLLDGLAEQARRHAQSMPPAQAAQVLWALAALQYSPLVAVLAALDAQIERGAFSLTAQGVSLVLWAYQAWRHHPQGATLAALAAALRARIAAFKPAELAACLQAFSALGFHPGNDVIQAVAQRIGVAVSPAALATPMASTERGLEAMHAGARQAAADAASASSEGLAARALYQAARASVGERAAAVSLTGRAAVLGAKQSGAALAAGVRERAQRALWAAQSSVATEELWQWRFGTWQSCGAPGLMPVLAQPRHVSRQLSSPRFCAGRDPLRSHHLYL